jgi:hypothetical protein
MHQRHGSTAEDGYHSFDFVIGQSAAKFLEA